MTFLLPFGSLLHHSNDFCLVSLSRQATVLQVCPHQRCLFQRNKYLLLQWMCQENWHWWYCDLILYKIIRYLSNLIQTTNQDSLRRNPRHFTCVWDKMEGNSGHFRTTARQGMVDTSSVKRFPIKDWEITSLHAFYFDLIIQRKKSETITFDTSSVFIEISFFNFTPLEGGFAAKLSRNEKRNFYSNGIWLFNNIFFSFSLQFLFNLLSFSLQFT